MTYNLKKDHVTNWDARNISDERDSPISERTSIASTIDDISPKKSPSTPPPPAKVPHSLRYYYNDMPENGVPLATEYKRMKAEEKKRQRNIRKAPPGQGRLAPVPESKPPGMSENFYPYWHYYKVKNPDWQLRYRQTADGQMIPYDSFDASKYTQEPALTVSPIKPNERSRKGRERREKSSAKQYIPLKDPDRDAMPSSTRIRHRRRRNEKDPSTHSMTDSSRFEESTAMEKKKKHHHHHHTTKPVPEPPAHHHHNHHHHHHSHHHLPSLEYTNSEFLVSDQSYKRAERSPFFQPLQGTSPSPPPAIYNQSSYLPPIDTRPTAWNYQGSPSQHTVSRGWIEPVIEHKVYKADPQTRFYDRYLNNIIDKRLTAL